ncbi:Ig-like domain-containing protein [Dyadobacter luticola]|uniref:T9SS type A sorting domain-containing protein n=1 Tax=Dyadobacter luticola TaxID=1979387 RepID=A0A5R9L2U1_9BACT|nr:Ig-like domain-containing protein [Dyadobacter luticola]TLV02570.1 T9SS type A sorting domain-containing protein [Dyadobacter luticola]
MRTYPLIWMMLLLSGLAFGQGQTREVSMCKAATLRINAASTGATRYEWYRNNEIIVGSYASELVVSEEGTYKAFGVNKDGCISDESIKIIVKHHKPTAVDDIATGKVNTNVLVDVLKNDQSVCAEFDASTLVVIQQPLKGAVTRVDGKFSFIPARDFAGEVTFTYQVSDKTGQQTNIANVKLDIVTNPLPVTLTHFDVTKLETAAEVTWGTSEESNSDHYDVERSQDLKNWKNIARVEAAFESRESREYVSVDSLPESGLNYYRLKMTDANATFTYSKIKSVHFPEFSWAELYPNPVNDMLHVVVRNKKVKNMRMISNSGIVRLSKPVAESSFTISMKEYPSGMYYIHFEQEDGTVKIFKLMHN